MSKQNSTQPPDPPSRSISVTVTERVKLTNLERVPYRSAPLWARCRWSQQHENYHGMEPIEKGGNT